MSDPLDALEHSISTLRRAIRAATATGDSERAGELRAQLRRAERAWDALVDTGEPAPAPPPRTAPDTPPAAFGSQLPAREHVHRALILLGTPAAPKLIVGVHEAFFPGELSASKLSSLRRDEARSYRSSPGARPYYLCSALAHDLLTPVRALLTISTWPLEQRIIGPLSPRVDFLTGAIRIAEAVHASETSAGGGGPSTAALRLLWRFAANIPDAMPSSAPGRESVLDTQQVIDAARTELAVHLDADRAVRSEASRRARALDEAQQLFGAPPQNVTPLRARA
ncbi:hypothetical protein [Streptomyces albidoflavus]|uniref:hypothetical protein n=1 Tax=Streptomyces albidoflavus TaxID=1886 RepID=UPI00331C8A9C